MRYRVFIEQDETGVYVAEVPALPGCISQGKTRSEAIDNIKEAIAGYLENVVNKTVSFDRTLHRRIHSAVRDLRF